MAAEEVAARAEQLLEQLEQLPDPFAREKGIAAVQAVVALYGEGLARILDRTGPDLVAELCEDELVAHLLFLHELHPETVEQRVDAAIAEVRPYLESHGGGVDVVAVEGETVRVRLKGSCNGCPASATTLEHAVEEAVRKAAPEIERIEAEEGEPAPQLLQLEVVESLRNGGSCPATEAG